MIKLIRKNQKKFMAIFGVGLMVMFIKGLVPDTGPSSPAARIVGTLAGAKITQTQTHQRHRGMAIPQTPLRRRSQPPGCRAAVLGG